jgi:hypothetical protein
LCLVLVPVIVPQPVLTFVPTLQAAVLPALAQVLGPGPFPPLPGPGPFPQAPLQGPAPFLQAPMQFLPLEGNTYAIASPVLFCGVDTAGDCEAMAEALAEITPGWGTTMMDGPDGYGVYLTYAGSA